MALSYKWPKVYPTITDLSQVVSANSETICGYVGEAEYGPINKPILVSGLKSFVEKFGNLNPKYGLAGYSLAVAQDTINSHYFVRVVDEDSARYAATVIPCEDKTVAYEDGYAVGGEDGIQRIIESEGDIAGALYSAIPEASRADASMIVLAQNPNNQTIKVSLTDSTIIETKAEFAKTVTIRAKVDDRKIPLGSETKVINSLTTFPLQYRPYEEGEENPNTYLKNIGYFQDALREAGAADLFSVDLNRHCLKYNYNAEVCPCIKIAGDSAALEAFGLTAGIYEGKDYTFASVPVDGEEGSVWPLLDNLGEIDITVYVKAQTLSLTQAIEALNTFLLADGVTAELAINGLKQYIVLHNPLGVKFLLEDNKLGKTLSYLGLDAGVYTASTIQGSTIEANWPISIDAGTISYKEYPLTVTVTTDKCLTNEEDEVHYLTPGKKIVISNCSDAKYNGIHVVKTVSDYEFTFELDTLVNSFNVINTRWVKYPEISETQFDLDVYLTSGKVTTKVEQFTGLTLYPHKDNTNNSTFVEDVVNGNSNYINIYTNADLDYTEVAPKLVTLAQLKGGSAGKVGVNSKYLLAGWDAFKDRSQTDVTILMGSGYSSVEYQSKMLEIAEARRDCFCLFDAPKDKTSESTIIDWRKNDQGFTSYRGALSAPWVKTYDSIQGKAGFLMAPSAYVAKIIGLSDPWVAPAGLNRGVINSATVSPVGLTAYFDDTEGGNLYSNQVNCIIKNPGAGYVNWGQKTLQQKTSALDRVNVARTVIFIETTLRDAARYQLFENNTAFLRTQIVLQFSQFLDRVLASGGLSRYKVVCDETNNTPYIIANNQLVIDIYLWPVYSAEFIILNTTVMGPDATVSVSTGA